MSKNHHGPATKTHDNSCVTCSTQDQVHATSDVKYGYGHDFPKFEKYGYGNRRSANNNDLSSHALQLVTDHIFSLVLFLLII